MFSKKTISFLIFITLFSLNTQSQTVMGAGVLIATIDGETDTIGLNISAHNEPNAVYCDANGGTSKLGMFHFIFENTGTYKEIKPQTFDLTKPEAYSSIQWMDFLTLSPYTYKNGKFVITSNDGKTLKGTFEAVASLGGASIMGQLFKGKKERILSNGIFKINYEK